MVLYDQSKFFFRVGLLVIDGLSTNYQILVHSSCCVGSPLPIRHSIYTQFVTLINHSHAIWRLRHFSQHTTWYWTLQKHKVSVDFNMCSTDSLPVFINRHWLERVHTFNFLGTHISYSVRWSSNTMAPVKGTAAYTLPESAEIKQPEQKAAGGLLPLLNRKPSGILHHSVIHALSCGRQKKTLERVINTMNNCCLLFSLYNITKTCIFFRDTNISDCSHPSTHSFHLSTSWTSYSSSRICATRLVNSFYSNSVMQNQNSPSNNDRICKKNPKTFMWNFPLK